MTRVSHARSGHASRTDHPARSCRSDDGHEASRSGKHARHGKADHEHRRSARAVLRDIADDGARWKKAMGKVFEGASDHALEDARKALKDAIHSDGSLSGIAGDRHDGKRSRAERVGDWLSRVIHRGEAKDGDGERFAKWLKSAVRERHASHRSHGDSEKSSSKAGASERLDADTLRKLVQAQPKSGPDGHAEVGKGGGLDAGSKVGETGVKLGEVLNDAAAWKALVERVLGEDCDDAQVEALRLKLLEALKTGDWSFVRQGVGQSDSMRAATTDGTGAGRDGAVPMDQLAAFLSKGLGRGKGADAATMQQRLSGALA